MSDPFTADQLIAHRGYPLRYPENTLPGLVAAIEAGAKYLEFDIQLTRDHTPVLCHDASLLRTSGMDRLVMELSDAELQSVDAGEPGRFGERFCATTVPSLALITRLLEQHPRVQAFVEIKRESLAYFGVATVVGSVMTCVGPRPQQFSVISFDNDCLLHARRLGSSRIGWAVEEVGPHTRDILRELRPDYLFTSVDAFKRMRTMLRGTWQWVIYQTTDPEMARNLIESGANLVETDAIAELLDRSRNAG